MNKLYSILFIAVLTACAHSNKCDSIGCEYLGTKYVIDPLGENALPDTDPLIRFDAFDCMTFVETVLAGGDVNELNKIRYRDGKIDFTNRNHFTGYDWVNNNSNLVENVSEKFGRTANRNFTVDKKNWFKKTHNIDADFASVTTSIKYIPYSALKTIETDEPLVVLFIINNPKMYDKIGSDLAVSHMGFLLPDDVFRHACSTEKAIVDMNFKEYTSKRKINKNNLGVALYRIKNDR